MHLVQVESNLGLIAGLGGGGRLHAGGDSVALAVQVQISLSAHQFGNFHLAGDVSAANLLDELGLVVNVLGTDAEHNILAHVIGQVGNSAVGLLLGHSDGAGAEGEGVIVAVLAQLGIDEVHLGRAHEAGHELVDGVIVQVLRSIDLLNEAVLHNHDAVAHGHSLSLVVGNVDKGGAQALMQLGNLGSHLSTQLGVQVGEGLVQQEHLGVTDDGAAQGNTLTLTTGQSLGLAVQQVGDVQDAGSLFHAALDFILGVLRSFRPKAMLSNTVM